MPKKLSNAALAVLEGVEIVGREVRITDGQLDRKLYVEVNAALEALGGAWNRKAKAHLFEQDPSDALDQLTIQQDATYLPAVAAAAAASPSAKPSTPTPPSNSSIDWSKLATGLVTAGGTVAAGAIKAKGAAQAAQAAQQAQMSAAARAAALAKAGLKTASSPLGMEVIGGLAALGLILFLAFRK